jgi:Na+/melibiose symporter-like transporter
MSLVPEITKDDGERVKLNSARYAGGIVASLLVLSVALYSFSTFQVTQYSFKIIVAVALGNQDLIINSQCQLLVIYSQ